MAQIAERIAERVVQPRPPVHPEVITELKRALEGDRELADYYETALRVVKEEKNQRGILVPDDMKKLAAEMKFHVTVYKQKLTEEKIRELFVENVQKSKERRFMGSSTTG